MKVVKKHYKLIPIHLIWLSQNYALKLFGTSLWKSNSKQHLGFPFNGFGVCHNKTYHTCDVDIYGRPMEWFHQHRTADSSAGHIHYNFLHTNTANKTTTKYCDKYYIFFSNKSYYPRPAHKISYLKYKMLD